MEGPFEFIPGNFLSLLKKNSSFDQNHVRKVFVPKPESTKTNIFIALTVLYKSFIDDAWKTYTVPCTAVLNPLYFPQGLPQPGLPPRRRNPPAAADGEGAGGGLHLRGAGGHLQQVRKKKRRLFVHIDKIFFCLSRLPKQQQQRNSPSPFDRSDYFRRKYDHHHHRHSQVHMHEIH